MFFFTILEISNDTFNRDYIKLLKENTISWAEVIETQNAILLKILKDNERLITSVYNNQINVRLFLQDKKYIRPLKNLIEISNKIHSLVKGISICAKNLQKKSLTQFGRQKFIDMLDKALARLAKDMPLTKNK
ncbi:MAG: hypothetical protein LBO62_01325 [Endomicrobium sp.]|jgi:hypothetical protein|nr:hypothetical protein [Endomicrobium sp.]